MCVNLKRLDRALRQLGCTLDLVQVACAKHRSGNRPTFDAMRLRNYSPKQLIYYGFTWSLTPQGFSFWENIREKIDEVYAKTSAYEGEPPVGKITRPKGRKYLCA